MVGSATHALGGSGSTLCARIVELCAAADAPVLIALDGRSGAGKSTLARAVGMELGALVIDGDDFYRGGDEAFWNARSPAEKVELVVDWERQRAVLSRLARAEPVTWQPYDWDADDGSLGAETAARPAGVVILDGAYSARAELADLYGQRVLLDVPRDVRRARLLVREGEHHRAEWEARWAEAEDLYFEELMPPEAFDLVLDGA